MVAGCGILKRDSPGPICSSRFHQLSMGRQKVKVAVSLHIYGILPEQASPQDRSSEDEENLQHMLRVWCMCLSLRSTRLRYLKSQFLGIEIEGKPLINNILKLIEETKVME